MTATVDNAVADLQRTIEELRQERDAALARETALADVLGIINSSPGDVTPVFEAIVEKAHGLCDAASGSLQLWDGEKFRGVAMRGFTNAMEEVLRQGYSPVGMPCGRLIAGEQVAHCVDLAEVDTPTARQGVAVGGVRTILYVALRRDDVLLGQIVVVRREVRPFSDREIALVENFAAQAVIAMENARLITETREALEQQTATAEVLGVISRSAFDLQVVLHTLVQSAARLCSAEGAHIAMLDGDVYRPIATFGFTSEFDASVRSLTFAVDRTSVVGRAAIERAPVQIADAAGDPEYAVAPTVPVGKMGSVLGVPLLRGGTPLGVIALGRYRVEPFTERQIELVQTFADQALIAMENARLLGDLRERTEDLQQSLEYQTATSDVLKVISRSAFDLQPVLDTLVATAKRLCNADMAIIYRRVGDAYRLAANLGFPPEYEAFARTLSLAPSRASVTQRAALERRISHVADIAADPEYELPEASELGNARTALGVPLLREGEPVGVFTLARQRVEPFTERQIELVRTFADQAVIAIENTRLITETREALEQQTATAEVLGVINSSPGDLRPVFNAMLEKATRLCEAPYGQLATYDGELFRFVAAHGEPGFAEEQLALGPTRPEVAVTWHRIVAGEDVVHIPDVKDTDLYRANLTAARRFVDVGGGRTLLTVALRKDDMLVGALTIYRQQVRPFTDKQIALLQNFAAQAVIAMENARLITETKEALDQQTATAQILGVINASPGDLTPVFEAILDKAHSLCGVAHGSLQLYDGEEFRAVVLHGHLGAVAELLRQGFRPGPHHPTQGLLAGAPFVHLADLAKIDDPIAKSVVQLAGIRTTLFVALRKGDALLGFITAQRGEVRPFSDKEIALLQNFATQAVIAMENARLITETKEALDQQTATAEVLQVINSSPGDLAPVFDAMLSKAMHLCEAAFGGLWTFADDRYVATALRGVPAAYAEFLAENTMVPGPGSAPDRFLHGERSVIQNLDLADEELYRIGHPQRRALVDLGGARTAMQVPLCRDDAVLGVITLYRQEVRPFSDKQIALLQNFAAQAVIAMENARLITETREALEQQTATAEVLGVINSSPGELTPVFDAILEKALSLCEASLGQLRRFDGETFHGVAVRGASEETADALRLPVGHEPGSALGAIVSGAPVVHIADVVDTEAYRSGMPSRLWLVEMTGARTALWIALRKDDVLLGVLILYRQEVRPFTDKQIALLQSFAAQAVIAMENARLLTETRQRQAELRVTFDSMADGVVMFDEERRLAAWNRNFQELLDLPDEVLAERPIYGDYLRLLAERGEFGSDDIEVELGRRLLDTDKELRLERTRPDGRVIEVRRNAVPDGGFVLIYSDITERKRSEEEIRAARDAAEAAYADLKAAQANLIQAEKMASLGQLTAGIAHEIKNPLNFVNNFASLSVELLDELKETAAPAIATLDEDKRADVDDTMELLTGNLEKIAEHGKRADNIVKSMLEHSRGVSGERRAVDLNGVIEEALNLAYHGARAQDQSFNITLERDYASSLTPVEVAPQEITRVFLNLFGNGFYAATKRARESGDSAFRPSLTVMTRETADAVEVRVRDNGIGIPPDIRDKLFQPFFTTKPTGEGTGLGLSISYDIVTQQHGGTITVESEPGAFTEFIIRLPRH